MLTNEQKAAVYRMQGQEKVMSALLNEVKEDLIKSMVDSEPHESKKREDSYSLIRLLNMLDSKVKSAVQGYKNTL